VRGAARQSYLRRSTRGSHNPFSPKIGLPLTGRNGTRSLEHVSIGAIGIGQGLESVNACVASVEE